MVKYKIGQLSKIMGVSTHLLKHYEKFNLVTPIKDNSTNYRYYDFTQCGKIIGCKNYRNMGFTIKDTVKLVTETAREEAINEVEKRIVEIENQIKELEQQKHMAEKFLQENATVDQKIGSWYIEERGAFYFWEQTINNELLEDGCLNEQENVLDLLPIAKSTVMIEEKSFKEEDICYHWGIMLDEESNKGIKKIDTQNNINLRKVSAGRVFVTYFSIETPYLQNGRLITMIMEKYQEFAQCFTSDVYANVIFTERKGGRVFQYFEIIIPL